MGIGSKIHHITQIAAVVPVTTIGAGRSAKTINSPIRPASSKPGKTDALGSIIQWLTLGFSSLVSV